LNKVAYVQYAHIIRPLLKTPIVAGVRYPQNRIS
jgi:hypothetical protein